MVLSGSSGNIDISHCPVFCSTTFDLALRTHSGWLRSGTSHAKNRNATTTMTRPRPRPNRKPSVRSSAPTRLSRTMSEIRTVMIETISRVPRKTPPAETPAATMSLLKYCFATAAAAIGIERDKRRDDPGADREDFAHKAPDHGKQPGDQHDRQQDDVEQRDRHQGSCTPQVSASQVTQEDRPARQIRRSHSGSGPGRQCRP